MRDIVLHGETYKIKTPQSDHAVYITINDTMKNEKIIPYEIFINTKNINNYIWLVSVSCLISVIFRCADNNVILSAIDDLKVLQDPNDCYFRNGEKKLSIISDIGHIIESHIEGLKEINQT